MNNPRADSRPHNSTYYLRAEPKALTSVRQKILLWSEFISYLDGVRKTLYDDELIEHGLDNGYSTACSQKCVNVDNALNNASQPPSDIGHALRQLGWYATENAWAGRCTICPPGFPSSLEIRDGLSDAEVGMMKVRHEVRVMIEGTAKQAMDELDEETKNNTAARALPEYRSIMERLTALDPPEDYFLDD